MTLIIALQDLNTFVMKFLSLNILISEWADPAGNYCVGKTDPRATAAKAHRARA